MFDSQSIRQKSVFFGLSVHGNSRFEFSGFSGDNQDSDISLRCSGDHVLNEIFVSRSIDDRAVVFRSYEFFQVNVDGNSSVSLRFQVIKYPSETKRSFSFDFCFILEFLEFSSTDSSAFEDQMSCGGRLSRVDMSDYDEIEMWFFLSHFIK